ncbi:hypothetical protein F4678DRAFT_428301 [Xylaria arbuscula]|nr:hypothetical protein F4678DRAFT_428301 [Xylaria arbuscula]
MQSCLMCGTLLLSRSPYPGCQRAPRGSGFRPWPAFGQAGPISLSLWPCPKCNKLVNSEHQTCPDCKEPQPPEQRLLFNTEPEFYPAGQPTPLPVSLSDWYCTECREWIPSGRACSCGRAQSTPRAAQPRPKMSCLEYQLDGGNLERNGYL